MRTKLVKFKENESAPNIIEPGKELFSGVKGRWREVYFKNERPITVEIGCGRGEYTVGLAQKFPERNYIGIDVKGDRIWHGAREAQEAGLTNVAFLRTRIEQLGDVFAPGEIDEIWITFPGPRPKATQENRRLTYGRLLDIYKSLLAPGGIVHVKTDSDLVYSYTLDQARKRGDMRIIHRTPDLYASSLLESHHGIQTRYERKFLAEGKSIKYLSFRFAPPSRFNLTKHHISATIRSLFGRGRG